MDAPCRNSSSLLQAVSREATWLGGAEREGARRALAWLESAQDLGVQQPGSGWGSDAPRALLALQLANCSWLQSAGALQVAGDVTWDRGGAMNLVLSHQSPDGSFGDTFTTTEVALALQPRGLAHVTECSCPPKLRVPASPAEQEPNLPAEIDLSNLVHKGPIVENYTLGPLVVVTYTLWAQRGLEPASALNVDLELHVPLNSSFYHVMQLAARSDPRYIGLKEVPTEYRYWLLYLLPQRPDVAHPPASELLTPRVLLPRAL
ncbi:hypothetical protein B566_EDAN008329 [Ephemera danica]|nr:hypothetical protein B566_EDAN008329 [Ephemera danica]